MNGKISNVIKTSKIFIYDHSPEILTGIGVTGMITSTVLAIKVTPKAMRLLEDKKQELNVDELTIKETVSTAWKPYLPVLLSTVASTSCLIGACTLNSKRKAALATAYTLSEKAYKTYRNHVIDTIGEKKEKKMRDEIAQENVNKNPIDQTKVIITSKGSTLLQDSISGRYFRSDLDTVKKTVNELNRRMLHDDGISLNEYYQGLGLENIKGGDNIGWNISSGLIELDFSACIADNDEPCIVIDCNIVPFEGFNMYS